MKTRPFTLRFALFLFSLCFLACVVPQGRAPVEMQPSPTPQPLPLVAYLKEGNLWVVSADGSQARQLAAAPEDEAINLHVWSLDGQQIFFAVGQKFFAVALKDGQLREAGELIAPEGTTIDRLELSRDGQTLIAHTVEAVPGPNSAPKIFAVTTGKQEGRELTVDEYQALAQPQSATVRKLGDLAVSPDGRHLLFKQLNDNHEQLFVSDIETGARRQITRLERLDGFEEIALLENERRILEAAWSPDGRYIIFNPAQSCSAMGLCYGRLFLVDLWGGAQYPLSREMMVNLPAEWNQEGALLAYDDGGQVVLANTQGQITRLGEGNSPKWQPGR
jgi:Tol biopolymer transport system component